MISGSTRVVGVIGDPVAHTASPAMQNAAFESLGLDWVYVAFHVLPEQLAVAIAGLRGLGLAGLNVTVPHKAPVMELLDEVAPEARAIGAVNTITHVDGRLIGYNTDGYGAMESLRRDGELDRLPACVCVLGAGGATRSVLYSLLARPEVERVLLLNRTVPRAEALAAEMDPGGRVTVDAMDAEGCARARDAGLLINTTSVGMHPNTDISPLADATCLHDDMVVFDIVYNPRRTLLMAQAEAAGARVIGGLGMLVYQGVRAFEIWTGQRPPVDTMWRAAIERFGDAGAP